LELRFGVKFHTLEKMLSKLKNYNVILASNSPRRQQLLSEIIDSFTIRVKPVDETFPKHLVGKEIAEYLSNLKSISFGELKTNELLITADTLVCLGSEVLNKPADKKEATEMLSKLSGNTHTVFTGVTVRTNEKHVTFSDATDVTFHVITPDEIDYYLNKCKPYDKAGSYGIQEWLGYVKIARMNGEFYNVMGLPLHRLYQVLTSW
jgi:septum formation protein